MNPNDGTPGPRTVAYAFLDFGDGGAQRLTLDTWRHLAPGRYRPHLVCLRGRGRLVPAAESAGVPVHVVGRLRRPWDLAAVPALAHHFRSLGAAVVHVPLYSRASPYARLAARRAGVALTVCHEHCRDALPSRSRRLVDRWLTDRRTRFVAVSEADRAWLLATGVRARHIAVVTNGVDTARFQPADRAAARAALGLSADAAILLVPARLESRKGQVALLAALSGLREAVPGVQVLFAGGGPLAAVLPALAAATGLGQSVRFLGPRDDVPGLMAAADVVVLPSRMEGLPLAVLEAMACARPVVATAVGGVAEAVADGKTGCLVPAGEPAALAAALAALLNDPDLAHAMGQRARQVALSRFRIEAATERLMGLYDGWLAELGPGRQRLAPWAAAVVA